MGVQTHYDVTGQRVSHYAMETPSFFTFHKVMNTNWTQTASAVIWTPIADSTSTPLSSWVKLSSGEFAGYHLRWNP